MFADAKWRSRDLLTGIKSFTYHSKIRIEQWILTVDDDGLSSGTVIKRNHIEPKSMMCILFKSTHVSRCFDRRKLKITNYTLSFLKMYLKTKSIKTQKSLSGTTIIKLLQKISTYWPLYSSDKTNQKSLSCVTKEILTYIPKQGS